MSTHDQALYWLRYQNQLIFSSRVYWTNEIDSRRFFGHDVQNQLITHSRIHYRAGRFDIAGGLTYSRAYAAIPENGSRKALAELRPVAEATHEKTYRRITLQNRLRLDHRFFQEDRNTSLLESPDYVLRLRYRVQVRFPLKQNTEGITTIGMRIGDEIMFNHKKNVYDQNRIYITSEYYITRNLSLEAGYLYIDQRRLGRDEYFHRHVLRFSVLHKVTSVKAVKQ
jgi:hypothetical protein